MMNVTVPFNHLITDKNIVIYPNAEKAIDSIMPETTAPLPDIQPILSSFPLNFIIIPGVSSRTHSVLYSIIPRQLSTTASRFEVISILIPPIEYSGNSSIFETVDFIFCDVVLLPMLLFLTFSPPFLYIVLVLFLLYAKAVWHKIYTGDLMKKLFFTLVSIFAVFILFQFTDLVFSATAKGVAICKDTLLPSLFPFMILSSFISYCGASQIISMLFFPITKLFSLPTSAGGIWFTSFVGGFPSGAACVCALYEINCIDRSFAEKIIPCCVCSGPAFLIIAIGKVMFNSYYIGLLLFVSQVISVIILTALFCKDSKNIAANHQKHLPFSVSLVSAVNRSTSSMLSIFSFVILFSILVEISLYSFPQFFMTASLFEVTIGCKMISEQLTSPILPIAFLTGFGGISVCLQVLSIAYQNGLTPKFFWTVRFLNGILCSSICFILLKLFPQSTAVYYSSSSQLPFAIWSVNSVLGAVCFGAMLLSALQKLDIYRRDFM